MGILYITAVPLGNPGDITLRAIDTLKSVDVIACEDTRKTGILLSRYEIKTKLIDCHKFNEKERSRKIIEYLEAGDVALVSDAGTPGICDPGSVLTEEVINEGYKIIPVPGACAVSTFLSVIPRKSEFYTFVGFLPRSSGKRKELFNEYKNINLVFYESPKRLCETLNDICEQFGKNKMVAIGRELTKTFEEIKIEESGTIKEYYERGEVKGELIGMIFAEEEQSKEVKGLSSEIKILKQSGFSDKDTAKILSILRDTPKNKIYEFILENQSGT